MWKVGCAVLALLGLLVGAVVMWGVGVYNDLVRRDEAVSSQWAQVENTYQRRADLIPNLVETVKGASEFEQETLNQVIEARSRVGQLNVDAASIVNSPEALARFQQTQDALSSALSRLLVVVERYPELRSVAAFQDLMVQLEGTENRIAVERRRFNEVAREFNTRRNQVPARLIADWFGFQEKAYFAAQEGADEVPRVDFGDD